MKVLGGFPPFSTHLLASFDFFGWVHAQRYLRQRANSWNKRPVFCTGTAGPLLQKNLQPNRLTLRKEQKNPLTSHHHLKLVVSDLGRLRMAMGLLSQSFSEEGFRLILRIRAPAWKAAFRLRAGSPAAMLLKSPCSVSSAAMEQANISTKNKMAPGLTKALTL